MSRRPVVRTVSVAERRARLAVRHRLAPSARTDEDTAAIARSVVVLHATDPLTVVLSAIARMRTPDPLAVERALFVDRSVLRMLGMRRTLFTVPVEDAPMIQAAASDAVALAERKRLATMLEDAGVTTDGHAWLAGVERKALAAMDHLGEATATDLAKAVPELGTRITIAAGKKYEATVSLASRILVVLGAEGHLVRGHPKGRWTGSQHRWTPTTSWLGQAPAMMPVDDARTALARRWLQQFGPGTVGDLRWWTGWTLGATRAALANIETAEVDLEGTAALVLAEDAEPPPEPEPWVALLPGLDPTIMGWFERDWYVGHHRSQVFDRNGNAGPTIWADGRVVGAWSQRKDGEVVTKLLEDLGAEQTAMVDAEAARLPEILGDIVVTPRFHSPLSRELSELMDATHVDKWVWAIRLYKTRADATDACRGGHVKVNGTSAKPATPVRIGDRVEARVHDTDRDVEVTQIIEKRVGAAVATGCFIDHTPPPAEVDRTRVAERERGAGRPTKRDRRQLDRWRG